LKAENEMKFHSLITAALLLACVAGLAGLASTAMDERAAPADAGASSLRLPPAREAAEAYVTVYRNGDLELSLRGTAGIDILRSGLADLFQDDHPATPRAWPQQESERRICAEQTGKAANAGNAGNALLDAVPASEPLSMGMLGAGFALMGWTRRRASWFGKRQGRQGWRFDVFPWPALCWLD
jgi:hypothetical protein